MPVARFRDEHQILQGLRAELAGAIRARDAASVGATRWRLYRILLTHLACEDNEIYRPMITHGGVVGRIARELQDEMGGLDLAFRDHIVGWPIARVTADWDGYEREVRDLMAALVKRIGREESLLFPLVAEAKDRFAA